MSATFKAIDTTLQGISKTASGVMGLVSGSKSASVKGNDMVDNRAQILRGRDVLNSNLGEAYIKIDGRVRRIFELKEITATIEQQKESVQLINDVMTKHKCVSSNGTGEFTVYTGAPDYSTMIRKYIDTHKGLYFTIKFTMDDPESTRGKRTVILHDCLIDSHALGRLSTESTILDEQMGFTFDEYTIMEDFSEMA